MTNLINKSIISAISFLFIIAFSPVSHAAENPFGMSNLDAQQTHVASKDGKCGEGKCGGSDKKSDKSGKCGEGKCGGSDKKSDKSGKCGEGKCGGSDKKSDKKGKCGEGKCGG